MGTQRATPEVLLSDLSECLAGKMGLRFSRERWAELERGIGDAASEFGIADVSTCIRWLLSEPLQKRQVEILASHLTVGETYFFREKRSFEVLQEHVLPMLLRARSQSDAPIRIWSAGCSTGEEPYSIAMVIDRLIPDAANRNISIFATDINPRFIQRAEEGRFSQWSFRGMPPGFQERYFERRKDGRFEIDPQVRRMVRFSYLNLAQDVYPSLANNTQAMDIIFCRNVLIYFGAEQAKQLVGNLKRCLVDGGWLFTGATETSSGLFSAYTTAQFPGVFLYRRSDGRAARSVTVTPPPSVAIHTAVLTAVMSQTTPREPLGTDRGVWGVAGEVSQQPQPVFLSQALQPSRADWEAAMARACANEGKLDEATRWCERAIVTDKLNPALYYLLATIAMEDGQREVATQALGRALYLDPQFVLAHFTLANLFLAQGRTESADRSLENARGLLAGQSQDDILPESDGLTAGRLLQVISAMQAGRVHTHSDSAST